ncbi:MAG: hypothetical protein MSF32_03980 [Dysosmobacter sp.]|nr:hypothetical protein [Dysosmobacter sp.]
MKKRYDEIMDKIEVTDEMRARILNHLQEVDLTKRTRPKVLRLSSVKKYLSVAACFAILLLGVLTLPGLLDRGLQRPAEVLNPGADIVDAATLEELSGLVNFEVPEVTGLPFTPEKQSYTAFGKDMAQITYEGNGQTCTFRKSIGSEDNSGDYNAYSAVEEISVGDAAVTLKGTEDGFTLAIWWDGAFSYSLQLSGGLTVDEWETLIAAVYE